MDKQPFFTPSDELSAEDLAILQAFDATEDLLSNQNQEDVSDMHSSQSLPLEDIALDVETAEDMLILFANEADEDIGLMRRALQQLEQENSIYSHGLVSLGRSAHKLKGTAGAMGCDVMSMISLHIEEEISRIKEEKVVFLSGMAVLNNAIDALESTLESLISNGTEDPQILEKLLTPQAEMYAQTTPSETGVLSEENENPIAHTITKELPELAATQPATHMDVHYLHALMSHTEHLIELNIPLQSAQAQVTKALEELQAAHARLRRLEGFFASVAFTAAPTENERPPEDHPASSLVTRILHEALARAGRQTQPKSRSASPLSNPSETALWDEMDLDRFTENRILLQSFSEAVADVATASSQLRAASSQLNTLMEQQVRQATLVRNDALRLRSAPFSVLLTRAQRAVQMIAQAHNQQVLFEVGGETTEIDQDVLEFLSAPLLQQISTSVADSLLARPVSRNFSRTPSPFRVWLQAQIVGNEVVIELGFSNPIPGGTLEALREPLQQLHGSMSVHRNTPGGVSYLLRFPRTQGIIHGLLVYAGGQGLVLPLQHIHAIDYNHQAAYAQLYNLATLLGFPSIPQTHPGSSLPVIVLASPQQRVAIQVDEIVGETELVLKPLAEHLLRPGVVGAAIDGASNVLLVLNLPTLIQGSATQNYNYALPLPETYDSSKPATEDRSPETILVADDSVYIRQSLRQTFERAGYKVIEARDGIEALEYLSSEQRPNVLLLDIEMPNLNGYDLLNILRSRPDITDYKIIMLTSRSSEKHRQRALELGVFAFLGKPCAQDILLETVRRAFSHPHAPI